MSFGERDGGPSGLMLHLSRNGFEHEEATPEYKEPTDKDFQDARKFGLAVEALRRVQDPHLVTQRRDLTRTLANLRVNQGIPLEEIAARGNLHMESFLEEVQFLQDTFDWANKALGLGGGVQNKG